MKYPQYEKLSRIRKYLQEVRGMRVFQRDAELWSLLEPICKSSSSTGCTFHELYVLYRHILTQKPKYVLELGAGVSTIVMAHAVKLCRKQGVAIEYVAMEDHEFYYDELKESFPSELKEFVQLTLSEAEDIEINGCISRRYKEKPEHPYELVFIDGPQIPSQKEDARYLDGDVLDVRKWNQGKFTAYLDCRIGTRDNIAKLLPEATVDYDKLHKFSRIDFPAVQGCEA